MLLRNSNARQPPQQWRVSIIQLPVIFRVQHTSYTTLLASNRHFGDLSLHDQSARDDASMGPGDSEESPAGPSDDHHEASNGTGNLTK
jgi:hypothetical protein